MTAFKGIDEKDRAQWRDILVFLEPDGVRLSGLSLEIIGKALEMRREGRRVYGVLMGGDYLEAACHEMLKSLPLDGVYIYQSDILRDFRADLYGDALCDCIRRVKPSAVLVGASLMGKDIAPYAAARLEAGLTADCISLELTGGGDLVQVRPAYGGDLMAEIMTPFARPQFATLRAGIAEKPRFSGETEPDIYVAPFPEEAFGLKGRIRVLGREPEPEKSGSILDSSVILAAGCGIRSQEDLEPLRELAGLMGGMLASTRGLVERGWMPPDSQIGLSGRSVAPKLLITLGVSGSVQFMAGIGGAKRVVAVNNDPGARIFSAAHTCLCADLYGVVAALLDRFHSSQPDAYTINKEKAQ